MRPWLPVVLTSAVLLAGCRTAPLPLADSSAAGVTPEQIRLDGKTLTFKRPGTDDVFALHLGDELFHDTGGITEVPKNARLAVRDATSSYYEPTDKSGAGYAAAESLYTRDQADLVARNTTVQYQPDSRRLLITEDKSDGRPCLRYILYTGLPNGGYQVTYLAPGFVKVSGGNFIDTVPASIRLLPGDRADIDGKTVRIDGIPQSKHPFSVGL